MNTTLANARELVKCASDIEYFAEKYIRVDHPINGRMPLVLRAEQKEMIKKYQDNKSFLGAYRRQCGKSTVGYVIMLHNILFGDIANHLILSRNSRSTIENVFLMHNHLPEFLRSIADITVRSNHSIHFSNGSTLDATKQPDHDTPYSTVYFDEAGFFDEKTTEAGERIKNNIGITKFFCLTSTRLNELFGY